VPTDIKPGSGCPGYIPASGRTLGLCIRCTRMGGRELEPAATVVAGKPDCVNFLPLPEGVLNSGAAGQGG